MFYKNLKNLRERDNLSQIRFAKEIGFSQAAISAWENNTREPGIEALTRIARFFNVSVDYLINKNSDSTKEANYYNLNQSNTYNFSSEELQLIKAFRQLPNDLRNRSLAYMEKLVEFSLEEMAFKNWGRKNEKGK